MGAVAGSLVQQPRGRGWITFVVGLILFLMPAIVLGVLSLKPFLVDFLEALAWPGWLVTFIDWLFTIVCVVVMLPVVMMYQTWLERKVVARIQDRIGANRVGKYGLLQPVADGIKMLLKEDIVPQDADKLLHFLAPVFVLVPAILIYAVMPFGEGMAPVDLNIGVLFFIAISSIETVAIVMAGYGSRNKFSLLGAMRAAAQIISYDIPLALSMVGVIMITGSLSTVKIVEAQETLWFVFTPWGLAGFLIFFLCGVAEVNRSPFDIPEAESEIVAGFHTEYSGMKFALFYMAEFLASFAVAGFSATLFLGGWLGPFLPSWLWFLLKAYLLFFVMMWFRGTLPRLRVDQLMGFAWKFLLPLTLINIVVAAQWYLIVSPWLPIVAWHYSLLWHLSAWAVGLAILIPSYLLLARLTFPVRSH